MAVSFEHTTHLNDERLQALLDGELPAREARTAHAHVQECGACRTRLEAWETVFMELGDLPSLAPSPAFRERVLEALPRPGGAGAKVRGWLRLDGDAAMPTHVGPARLQEFMEGRLAARTSARVEAHLDGCAVCRGELQGYQAVARAVERLPVLTPSDAFRERVMAGVRVESLARAVLAPTSRTERLLAWARRAIPSSPRGWAATLGVATAPAVIAALAVNAVFSHPLVTVGGLASFVWLKLSSFAGGAVGAVSAPLMDNALVSQVWAMVEPLLASSRLVAASATVLSALTLAALWILYRNVLASDPEDHGYAQSTL